MDTPGKPRIARHLFSDAAFALFALIIIGAFFLAAFWLRPLLGNQLAAVVSATLVTLANEDREAENLGELTVSPVLAAAAKAKAEDMAEKGYFSHVSPDGKQPWYWLTEAGYAYVHAGENLAVNFTDSENVEKAWMDSPSHRANIMDARFTEVGIATAVGEYKGKRTTFVVQMFGTPKPTAPVVVAQSPRESIPEDPEEPAIVWVADVSLEEETAELPPEAPAVLQAVVEEPAKQVTLLVASPEKLLQGIYIACALILLIALAFVTRLELRKHHLPHVVMAVLLIVLMGGLFLVADRLIFTEPILASSAWVP